MFIQITLLLAGIILLWVGSGLVIESAKKLAKRFRISHALIGLTIISIGTSLPEIFTNIFSAINNINGIESSGIAVGTNIGSCLTQITLILGLAASIGTMYATKRVLFRDGAMVLVAIIAMFLTGLNGTVTRLEGLALLIAYTIYIVWISKDEITLKEIARELNNKDSKMNHIRIVPQLSFMAVGIAVLIIGSKFVVDNAVFLAKTLGLTESFIGVMIIGVGTCLPELTTSIRGITKGAYGISLGTLIGSNITDPMLSLGSGAVISGFAFNRSLLLFDIPFWFFATLTALFMIRRKMRIGKQDRKEGITLILLYVIFVSLKIAFFS